MKKKDEHLKIFEKFLKVKLTFELPNEEERIAIYPERNPVAPAAPTGSRIFDTKHQIFFLFIWYNISLFYKEIFI